MNFLRLIRFPNIIIVVLTQYLLQYSILLPDLSNLNILPFLSNFHFFLLVLSTSLIAASGYIINDIEDVEIDKINRPVKKQIIGRIYPLSIARKMYWGMVIFGFIISLYLAIQIKDFIQLSIYPVAVALLWAYSKWFKKMALVGNLIVAFFCAFVAWVVIYAQYLYKPSEYEFNNGYLGFQSKMSLIFASYAAIAFISTLFREIIKDIEDAEGDKMGDCKTLPVLIGIEKSKYWAFMVGLIFLSLVFIFSFILRGDLLKIAILNITISLPIIYVLFLLIKANKKEDFSYLSKLAKFIMLSGLVFLLIMKL